jgi:arylsulfatase A-like enzyme
MEPHMPYEPPEPYLSRFARPAAAAARAAANDKVVGMRPQELSEDEIALLESLYDGEVACLDEELRLLFAELDRLGVLHNAVVVVTADHGEEFREHGLVSHGMSLYESAIRVPLILLAPGLQGGSVVEQGVSLIDLAPTILDLAGVPPEPRFVGRSLVPLLTPGSRLARWRARLARLGHSAPPPDLLSELFPTGEFDLRVHRSAYLRLPRKLIVPSVGAPELYDLTADPGERNPRTVHEGEPDADLYDALERTHAALANPPGAAPGDTPAPLDDATREKLRALGYQP